MLRQGCLSGQLSTSVNYNQTDVSTADDVISPQDAIGINFSGEYSTCTGGEVMEWLSEPTGAD